MGKFYRPSSIVLNEMTLKDDNISLITFEPREVDGFKLSAIEMKNLMKEARDQGLPVVLRVGAIDYKIGSINTIRVGRDEAFGDADITLKGELELEPIYDDEKKVIDVKPGKYVYTR